MTVISFVSPKGGVGKTTTSFILASELAFRGFKITIIDADPNHPIARWQQQGGETENLEIITSEGESSVMGEIEKAGEVSDFVIVDLEGTASLTVPYAIMRSDLVVVPCQRSNLDLTQAAKAIKLVCDQGKAIKRNIPVYLVMTRTSPVIRSRGLRKMTENLSKNNIDVFDTELHDREAYKATFDYNKTLNQLTDKEVSSLEKAKVNASLFAAELLQKLTKSKESLKIKEVEVA